jgi:hypothetical protein
MRLIHTPDKNGHWILLRDPVRADDIEGQAVLGVAEARIVVLNIFSLNGGGQFKKERKNVQSP